MVPWSLSKQLCWVVPCCLQLVVCLSLTESCFPPFFLPGFFKVLGQLTETGVVSPEQFISEYLIIPWLSTGLQGIKGS